MEEEGKGVEKGVMILSMGKFDIYEEGVGMGILIWIGKFDKDVRVERGEIWECWGILEGWWGGEGNELCG